MVVLNLLLYLISFKFACHTQIHPTTLAYL